MIIGGDSDGLVAALHMSEVIAHIKNDFPEISIVTTEEFSKMKACDQAGIDLIKLPKEIYKPPLLTKGDIFAKIEKPFNELDSLIKVKEHFDYDRFGPKKQRKQNNRKKKRRKK